MDMDAEDTLLIDVECKVCGEALVKAESEIVRAWKCKDCNMASLKDGELDASFAKVWHCPNAIKAENDICDYVCEECFEKRRARYIRTKDAAADALAAAADELDPPPPASASIDLVDDEKVSVFLRLIYGGFMYANMPMHLYVYVKFEYSGKIRRSNRLSESRLLVDG